VKITNKWGLPEPLVKAIQFSDRDREGCDYTITELLQPARISQLRRIHEAEITEDASDRIWLLLGAAGHEVLRRSADKSRIVEERAIVEVDGFKVGGQIDYSEADNTIWDYKFTSVWAAKEGPKKEWIQQLNCYRWLASHYGVNIEKLQIVAIYRDWSKSKASREQDFPQSQVEVFDIDVWTVYGTEAFIKGRIEIHEAARKYLPECTPDEMWERPATFAVKKPGGKRAIKLHATRESAENHALGNGLDIEIRPAVRPRCEDYCPVAEFCDQWKAFQKANQ
jgi:hypothetical protein